MAREAAQKAIALEPSLGEAYEALATIQALYDWDPRGAEQSYRRALELDPGAAESHQDYGQFLMTLGRFDESRIQMRRAAELDPVSAGTAMRLAWPDYTERRYESAVRQLRAVNELYPQYTPSHHMLAKALMQLGHFEQALVEEDLIRKAEPTFGEIYYAGMLAAAGRRAEAEVMARGVEARASGQYVPPVAMAFMLTQLGDKDRAFQWLEKAYVLRSEELINAKVEPTWDPLRSDPRFDQLLAKVGFWK
jgi:Tfp pilus assembly protein PilF